MILGKSKLGSCGVTRVYFYLHAMNKIVLITGATSGFGMACARKFAANGYSLILNGRREDKLHALCAELENKHGSECTALPFDVRKKEQVFDAVNSLQEKWKAVDVLINNAGLALGRDLFQDAEMDDWETMIDTNLKGLLYVSRAVVPFMIERKQGHIINIGSIAGKEAYERGNVYCASKAAVDSLTKGMRLDLLSQHIKVTAIHPGAAETEFSLVRYKGATDKAEQVYDGYTPLGAEDVADIVYFTASLPKHVCINDLVVTPAQQANSFVTDKSGRL